MSRSRGPRAAEPPSPTQAVDRGFVESVGQLATAPRRDPELPLEGSRLTGRQLLALFDDQMRSRHLDLEARALRERGAGYYTIGSSGHEGNAAVAEALRVDDPALLHYRSGAFFLTRARRAGYADAARDVLLGMVASREEPIAGGRHKVIGSRALWIPPQTSTIASHLPKAMGMAFSLELARHLRLPEAAPRDAIVLCSFGDASLNHSAAQGALNAAAWMAHQHRPCPILFLCEDNGIGISVTTPAGWVEAGGRRASIRWFHADGTDLIATHEAALDAAAHVRKTRSPAFLHIEVTRLLGHAGSDVEQGYRPLAEIRAAESRDPLRRGAALVVAAGLCEPGEVIERYEAIRAEVNALADEVRASPGLRDAADVMAPLAPRTPDAVAAEARRAPPTAERERLFQRLPESESPGTLAQQINRSLLDLLAKYPGAIVFGQDVARKGGVYGITRGLRERAGAARVFDTLLDEQSILGVAQGAGHLGLLPVPEVQYLAYLHNAEDQLRGEAASLQFFSQAQFRCPMVLRIAGYAYQKGFGGHFHNDNAVGVLRDIPGIVIASPALGDDAAAMLRTCAALAQVDGAVCVFLEPIALYHERDLHERGDGGLLTMYPAWDVDHVPPGRARVHGDGTDLGIITFANGLRMSLRAARRLEADGIRTRVVDLRWLAPLPVDDILAAAQATGRVLVVDETRASGGVSEGVITALVDAGFGGKMRRVTSMDSFVPLGPAADHVLLGEAAIDAAARSLL
jgi:2-oxoisovalerate dehydrogenase E1 component